MNPISYTVLVETNNFKFRQIGITNNPSKNFMINGQLVFQDEANNKLHKFNNAGGLTEVVEAHGVLCGCIVRYFTTKKLAQAEKKKSGGRLLPRSLKPIDKVETSI